MKGVYNLFSKNDCDEYCFYLLGVFNEKQKRYFICLIFEIWHESGIFLYQRNQLIPYQYVSRSVFGWKDLKKVHRWKYFFSLLKFKIVTWAFFICNYLKISFSCYIHKFSFILGGSVSWRLGIQLENKSINI